MIHLFINALAASAGGGLTYVRNIIPQLSAKSDVRATVLLDNRFCQGLRASPNVTLFERDISSSPANRFFDEQRTVPRLIRQLRADVLLSAGNFAIFKSPVPQILLSRNSLYTSRDFERDLQSRGEYKLWLDTQLKGAFAKWSIQAADVTVAPSKAFASDLKQWTGKPITAIYHGFDRIAFSRDTSPLPPAVREKLQTPAALRLLFVSHYNYYRNFETLIRALALIRRALHPQRVRLFLTCRLKVGENHGGYHPDLAATLVRELDLSNEVVELDAVPYQSLHQIYHAADIYVTPAYAESFAHPLVEAMSSRLPVVASDLAVHKEICGPAAVYFSRFSPEELCKRVLSIARSSELKSTLVQSGLDQASKYSWSCHVDQILSLARKLVGNEQSG